MIDWFQLGLTGLGGLALFLYGMSMMAEAAKAVAGDRMKAILGRLSSNRFTGMLTGAGVTAVVQSSSVTTVMLVGFVSADLMSLSQSIGVILGANIGTTITAQLLAFEVAEFALVLVAVGFGMLFTATTRRVQEFGRLLMGLGLLFFGMTVMSGATEPLLGHEPSLAVMAELSSPLGGVVAAAVFTAVIRSSSATMAVVLVLAAQGLIDLGGAVALMLGSNLGTCVTAAAAAVGKPREAERVAAAHLAFNLIGVLLALPLLPWFIDLIVLVSPSVGDATSAPVVAAAVPRQVANGHTLFNLMVALVCLPFTAVLAGVVTRLVPDRAMQDAEASVEARYLDPLLLETPSLALDAARRELGRIGRRVVAMVDDALPIILHGEPDAIQALALRDEEIDALYARTVGYLGDISRKGLTQAETRDLVSLMAAANDAESVGDVVEADLVNAGLQRHATGLAISPATEERLGALHAKIVEQLQAASTAVEAGDLALAEQVMGSKEAVNHLVEAAEQHQAARLLVDEPDRVDLYALETDVIDKLKRIYYHAKRMAKAVAGAR